MWQLVSESTRLFELFCYWDKLVHPTLVALKGMIDIRTSTTGLASTDSDFQTSNTDTMSDFLCSDEAVVIATIIAVRVMAHLSSQQKRNLGALTVTRERCGDYTP